MYVDGAVIPRKMMNLSSSFDHRVVDGADAAAFIQRIKALIETPALLFLDLTTSAWHAVGSMSVAAPTLTGTHVQLEQLRVEYAEELTAAGNEDRSTYGWTPVPPTVEGMQKYINGLLGDQQARSVVPFAQRRLSDGALVGCTRYLRLEWWGGARPPRRSRDRWNVAGASAQRTPLNTEAKYLLLSNAFDDWNVHRVLDLHRLAEHPEPDGHPADRRRSSRASS